jgi:hypothetical protein
MPQEGINEYEHTAIAAVSALFLVVSRHIPINFEAACCYRLLDDLLTPTSVVSNGEPSSLSPESTFLDSSSNLESGFTSTAPMQELVTSIIDGTKEVHSKLNLALQRLSHRVPPEDWKSTEWAVDGLRLVKLLQGVGYRGSDIKTRLDRAEAGMLEEITFWRFMTFRLDLEKAFSSLLQ